MQTLDELGHDPTDRLQAMALAHGVRDASSTPASSTAIPSPPPTYEALARARQLETRPQARPRHQILEMFRAQ